MAKTGVAIFIILAGMGCGWAVRQFLIARMRTRHHREFEALGSPSGRVLSSAAPKHNEQHVRFWKYLWGGKFFLLNDGRVSILAAAALVSDAVLLIGIVLLFSSVGK